MLHQFASSACVHPREVICKVQINCYSSPPQLIHHFFHIQSTAFPQKQAAENLGEYFVWRIILILFSCQPRQRTVSKAQALGAPWEGCNAGLPQGMLPHLELQTTHKNPHQRTGSLFLCSDCCWLCIAQAREQEALAKAGKILPLTSANSYMITYSLNVRYMWSLCVGFCILQSFIPSFCLVIFGVHVIFRGILYVRKYSNYSMSYLICTSFCSWSLWNLNWYTNQCKLYCSWCSLDFENVYKDRWTCLVDRENLNKCVFILPTIKPLWFVYCLFRKRALRLRSSGWADLKYVYFNLQNW